MQIDSSSIILLIIQTIFALISGYTIMKANQAFASEAKKEERLRALETEIVSMKSGYITTEKLEEVVNKAVHAAFLEYKNELLQQQLDTRKRKGGISEIQL